LPVFNLNATKAAVNIFVIATIAVERLLTMGIEKVHEWFLKRKMKTTYFPNGFFSIH
jgi:hypothetical protein